MSPLINDVCITRFRVLNLIHKHGEAAVPN